MWNLKQSLIVKFVKYFFYSHLKTGVSPGATALIGDVRDISYFLLGNPDPQTTEYLPGSLKSVCRKSIVLIH
jgi:hypothetical protein